jgi:hypothetical protein
MQARGGPGGEWMSCESVVTGPARTPAEKLVLIEGLFSSQSEIGTFTVVYCAMSRG